MGGLESSDDFQSLDSKALKPTKKALELTTQTSLIFLSEVSTKVFVATNWLQKF